MEAHKESTIKDFLEVIFRRKWIILGIVMVATITVITMNIRGTAVYESSTRVLVKRGEAQGVFSRSVRTLTWEEEIASQIELIKSQVVLNRAQELLEDFYPDGYESSLRLSSASVNSSVISTSSVLWISYISYDPLFCEAAVNAIAHAYNEYYQSVRTPPEMEDFFLGELKTLKDDIEYWRERKERVEREWGIVDIDRQRVNTLNRLERYQIDLDEAVQERQEIEEIIKRLEAFRSLSVEEQSAILNILLDPSKVSTIRDMRKNLLGLRIQESEMSTRFTDDNRNIIKLRKQIDDLSDMMDREIQSLIVTQRSMLEIIKRREETLIELIGGLRIEKEHYPQKEVELERINVTLERLERNYTKLIEQHMDSKVSLASNPEWTVTILAPASKAYQRKRRDYVRIALGPLFSLIVALGFAFFIDNLDHSIKNVSEAETSLGLSVLASFPDVERNK